MLITSEGYDIKFIQRVTESKNSCHPFTYIYKFQSKKTKTRYIIHAQKHRFNIFFIKFYAQKHSGLDDKFSKILNENDAVNVMITAIKIIPNILKKYPKASFGFLGSGTVDLKSNKVEDYNNNQRFRIYKHHITQLVGEKTFEHKYVPNSSCYAMYNRKITDVNRLHNNVYGMIKHVYDIKLNL